jgi:phage terminase Nu1 subunit (DNA packaging protein)
MDDEITTAQLAQLFSVTAKTIADLGKRKIIERGNKRGTWRLFESVNGYVTHLRAEAAVRGGEEAAQANARLGQAQAALAEAKAVQLRSELVEADAVEKLWANRLRAFRNRILGIPQRVQYLSPRQTVVLQQELRAALDELADESGRT